MRKTLVLAHGYHVQTENWHDVVWGNPLQGQYGRLPRALELIAGREDVWLCIGSGGSHKNGLSEAEVSLQCLYDHLEDVRHFPHPSAISFEDYIQSIVCLEKEAVNTTGELIAAMEFCVQKEVGELLLVSSPTHIPRCLLEAEKLRQKDKYAHIKVMAVASDVSYVGYGPEDVVIIEPPHRGDMPQIEFHQNAKKLFQFLRSEEVADGFNEAWEDLIEHWRLQLPKE